MNGVFIDSNVIIFHLTGNKKAKQILKKCEDKEIDGYVNLIVFSEVFYNFIKLITKMKAFQLKKHPERVASIDFSEIKRLFKIFSFLEINRDIAETSMEIVNEYGLLPNDALIAATCKYYGIKKIATFDEDFKRVEFLEVIDLKEKGKEK